MGTLIVKLDASGDVVRTTPLLARLGPDVTWVTSARNAVLVDSLPGVRCLTWERREQALDRSYDLAIGLEDDLEPAEFVVRAAARRTWGAYAEGDSVAYTDDSSGWFDLGLVSRHGRTRADELKYVNRRSYQDLVFEGLGWRFTGEPYRLPAARRSELRGDVAVAPIAGPVWPMKAWSFYDELVDALRRDGLRVNVLPKRESLLEHLGDIANHRCLVCGDSLPMHLALGLGVRCVALFNCTSPWEIHDYGLLTKVVSPLLGEYFYRRGFDPRATAAIPLDAVYRAVRERLAETERSEEPCTSHC